MAADAWHLATHLVFVATFACLGVLAVRARLRRRFGARMAYAAWLAVPCITLAALLPAPVAAPIGMPVPLPRSVADAAPAIATSFDARPWLAAVWLLGGAATALVFALQQRRYVRSLGRVQSVGARVVRSPSVAGGPALVGAWRPRIVLPADFRERYAARERALILAHERVHLARGDALANAVVAAARCVAWFNPIVHWAAARFRYDQELACDAVVIERFPEARATYAGAMLKTQLAEQARPELRLPAGCGWPSRHPLTERILMLRQRAPSRAGRACGLLLIAALGGFGGYAAWAAQAPRAATAPDATAEQVDAHLVVTFGTAKPSSVRLVGAVGVPIEVAGTEAGSAWRMAFIAARGGGAITLEATVTRDGRVVAQPSLVVVEGRTASIEYGAGDAPDHFRFDATLFLHAPGWRPDADTADGVVDRAASEDVQSRVDAPPVDPSAAIAAHPSGHVEPRATVDADGHLRSATVARRTGAGGRGVR